MNISEFCSKYKRHTWSRFLLKHPEITQWDLVEHNNMKVLYNNKHEVLTRKCLKCGIDLQVGFGKEEYAKVVTHRCVDSSNQITRLKLETLFSDQDFISNIITGIISSRTCKFPNKVAYWIDQGLTYEDAQYKIKEVQTKRSALSPASQKGARGYSNRTIEYWLKKGYDLPKAQEMLRKSQTTNGLSWYIQRYGDIDGPVLFDIRITQWLETYYTRCDIELINKSKGKTRKQHIEELGLEGYLEFESKRRRKIIQTKINLGNVTSKADLEERTLYYEKVGYYTRHSLRYYFDLINPTRLKIGVRSNHVDHLYSRHFGFRHNIPPEVIGCFCNLKVISWRENIKKGITCTISLDELMENYEKSKIDNGWPF